MLAYQTENGLPLINGIPVHAIFGGVEQGGMHSSGDLVTHLADGTDINTMWNDMAGSLKIHNEAMDRLIQLITFPVTNQVESVAQSGEVFMDKATEYGIPMAGQVSIGVTQMGYGWEDYDKRGAFTWKFLKRARREQIDAYHDGVIRGDKRQIFHDVMAALFDPRTRYSHQTGLPYTVYPLYNGVDGPKPPDFNGNTFDLTHSHYLVSGAAVIDSGDLDALYNTIAHHGFSKEAGTGFIVLMNQAEAEEVRKFRVATGSKYDFIPSPSQPPQLLVNAEGLLGNQPEDYYRGVPIFGSYGWLNCAEDSLIPAGYVVILATGGKFALSNPVGLLEDEDPAMRGLRILAGNQQGYPLVDGFYFRGFGTGVRQRGGAAVMQIKASGSYVPPAAFVQGGPVLV